MLSCIRLPLRFDAAPLQADVAALPAEDWVPHFNTRYYQGDWSGVGLRTIGGGARELYPDPNPRAALGWTRRSSATARHSPGR